LIGGGLGTLAFGGTALWKGIKSIF
jgi:hypothetical protein